MKALVVIAFLSAGCADTRSLVLPNPHCVFLCSATTTQVNTPELEPDPPPKKEQR